MKGPKKIQRIHMQKTARRLRIKKYLEPTRRTQVTWSKKKIQKKPKKNKRGKSSARPKSRTHMHKPQFSKRGGAHVQKHPSEDGKGVGNGPRKVSVAKRRLA